MGVQTEGIVCCGGIDNRKAKTKRRHKDRIQAPHTKGSFRERGDISDWMRAYSTRWGKGKKSKWIKHYTLLLYYITTLILPQIPSCLLWCYMGDLTSLALEVTHSGSVALVVWQNSLLCRAASMAHCWSHSVHAHLATFMKSPCVVKSVISPFCMQAFWQIIRLCTIYIVMWLQYQNARMASEIMNCVQKMPWLMQIVC